MAFYSEEDDEQAGASGNGQAVNKPGSGLVAVGVSGSTAAPAEAAKNSTPGNAASPFVGINEYLNANKQQSGKLGATVGNYVGGKIDSAEQKLGQAESDFGKKVDQNTAKFDGQLGRSIEKDAGQVLKDQNTLGQVRNIQKGYTGPTDFKSDATFQGVNQDIQKAKQANQNLGTATGQANILQNQQTDTRGGKLNRGAATLDQALLSASPEARAALQPAMQKGKEFDNKIDSTIASAMNKVSGAQKTSADSQAALKGAFDTQYAQQQAALQNKVGQTNANLAAQNQAIKQRVLSGDVSDLDLQMLGIGRGDYDSLRQGFQNYGAQGLDTGYGLRTDELGNYLNFSGSDANMQNVASQEDYARAQALRELAGYGGDYLSNPSQAGSYNSDLANFDLAGAKGKLDQLKSQYKMAPIMPDFKINLPQLNYSGVGSTIGRI